MCKIVSFLWSSTQSHVFESFHGGIEVEILDVDCHVAGVLGGDGAVLVQLDGEQSDGRRTAVAGIYDAVPSHCRACSIRVVFCWSEAHHDASIRDILPAVGWDVLLLDEEYRVGAFDSSRHALGEAHEGS